MTEKPIADNLSYPFYQRALRNVRRVDVDPARDEFGAVPTPADLASFVDAAPGVGGAMTTIISGNKIVGRYVESDDRPNVLQTRFARKPSR